MKHLINLVLTLGVIFNLVEVSSASSSPSETRDLLKNFGASSRHSNYEELGSTSGAGPALPEQPSRVRERLPVRPLPPDGAEPFLLKITDWVPDDAWFEDRFGFHQIRERGGVRIFEVGQMVIGRISGDYIVPIFSRDRKFLLMNKLSERRWVYDNIEEVRKCGVGKKWLLMLADEKKYYDKRLHEATEKYRN